MNMLSLQTETENDPILPVR